MNYTYQVVRKIKGKREESGVIQGPEAESMASSLAEHWKQGSTAVTILRASDAGVNAGKHLLHRIVK